MPVLLASGRAGVRGALANEVSAEAMHASFVGTSLLPATKTAVFQVDTVLEREGNVARS